MTIWKRLLKKRFLKMAIQQIIVLKMKVHKTSGLKMIGIKITI
jgi:hypothetical protein